MKEIIISLVVGFVCGFIFRAVKLPLPAPTALAGVMGILGIFLGGGVAERLMKFLGK